MDYAREVLGMATADHEESNPGAEQLAITALSCSLVGSSQVIRPVNGTRTADLYGRSESLEDFHCSYGVNPALMADLEDNGLRCSAVDTQLPEPGRRRRATCEVRAVEIIDHPFFIGTLFMPQTRSTAEEPHPILAGFEAAVAG